jgi:hypothetical protein
MARTWKAVSQFIAPGLATVASGLLARKAKTPREFAEARVDDVFHRQDEPSRKQGIESGLVRHLRNHSRYLLEGGFLGKVRIAGLVLSGLAWNVMILLPVPLTAALLAWESGEWLWGEALQPGQFRFASLMTARAGQFLWAFGTVFCAFWVVLPGIQLLAHGKPPDSKRARLRRRWESSVLWLGLATVAVGALCLVPGLFHLHESLRTRLASEGVAGSHLGKLGGLLPTSVTGVAGAALAALAAWLTPRWPRLRALAARLLVLSGPLLLLFVFLLVANQMGLVRAPGDGVPWDPLRVFWVTLGLTTWAWVCVNINTLAPHRYYRDRLCECYLVRRTATEEGWWHRLVRSFTRKEAPGRTEVLQQVKLSSLGADPAAPYHLINMTVNVPTSGNKNLRGRGSDFCLASRHFYGSPLTGYGRTEELEKMDPHFDLGTAMAVSGAAASTAMGWKTLPHFRFLMALFNVRLGYWLRNPNRLARSWWVEGAGPWYLFREMLGRMDENCRYLNLSDGGHIENLAVYELLRRQCKFIVSVDAGQEPGMECADLIRLQRYAEIDLGIRLHFDTADLQIGPNGLSRAHAILVKIDYAPETAPGQQLGWLLYLKLAMTGVEPNYVTDYRRGNPDFPHQTTGDQIYDEAQFEAYRALGECAMEGMLREEIVGKRTPGTVRAWFQCLANNLLPDNDEAFR